MYHVALVGFNDIQGYGRRCISSSLKNNGFRASNVVFGCHRLQDVPDVPEKAFDTFDGIIRDLRPDLVGFSMLSTYSHPTTARLARHVKRILDVPVVFGGIHASMASGLCLKEQGVDYVCMGEGEEGFVDLCRRLSSGQTTDDVPGFIRPGQSTYTKRNPPQDLNALPFQDVGNEDKCTIFADGSLRDGDPLVNGMVNFHSTRCSRGCPFHCSFCSNNTLRTLCEHPSMFLRRRTPENVIEELREYLTLNPDCRFIRFWDEIFPLDRSWVDQFAALYKKQIGVPFTVWFHPNTVVEENLVALRSAGLREAQVGLESASPETRKKVYLRPETQKQILDAHEILAKQGVDIRYDFIIEHPWESPTELQDTFELAMSLEKPYELNMHNLALFPGTGLAKRAVEEGYLTEEQLIDGFLGDTYGSSRKLWWGKNIPVQRDFQRAYWVFLIMCAGSPQIPRWFVRFLAGRKLLTRHPTLLTGRQVNDIGWNKRDQILDDLPRRQFAWRVLARVPGARRVFGQMLNSYRIRFALVVGGIAYRLATRLPMVLVKEIRGSYAAVRNVGVG